MKIKWKSPFLFFAAIARSIWMWWTQGEIFVSDYEANMRINACRSCLHLDDGGQCELCTCFVSTKTLLVSEECPVGRWPKQ